MLLSARILRDVADVNRFRPAEGPYRTTEGDGDEYVYFQLVDAALDTARDGFSPPYRRYVAAEGAILSVRMESLDTAKVVTRAATRPWPLDGSVWRVARLAADPLRGTVGWLLTLTEGSSTRVGRLQPAMCVQAKALVG